MHAPRKFRKAFMAQLLVSLRAAGQASKSMGLWERRDAVRLSSDVAMALASARARSAPRSSAAWARALVARHAAERRNEALMRRIMGGAGYEMAAAAAAAARSRKEERSRRIVRRSRRVCSGSAGRRRRVSLAAAAASGGAVRCSAMAAARRMVKARLRVLRSLVPGGEALRGLSLLSETLDYVVCLKTQVELMQCLCKGSRPKLG
ncbi:transcription factor IBH1-like [Panicum miliaceum]|uniref:Transcription factor IBH1-like n=1 Tax=Panicum miliaceum TaxID=4540 RepID=A0A3L6QW03_PANMI|nr:transcription factor IBH1-like [Panicum miliaceum]